MSAPTQPGRMSGVNWIVRLAVLAGLAATACAHSSDLPFPSRVSDQVEQLTLVNGQTLVGKTDLLALEPFDNDGFASAVIEIPAGTLAKWEIDKAAPNTIRWEEKDGAPRIIDYLAYPANYGAIPGTMLAEELGGDGDPLDVVVLGAALARGEIVQVRLLGVLRMIDGGEQDDKLIAVPIKGSPFSDVHDIAQLDREFAGVSFILETWFRHYKGQGAKIDLQGFEGPDAATALVIEAMKGRE